MDEQLIEQLYREYWDCMINKDIQGMSEIMIEDYTLMHMTGMRQSKESFFQSVQNGELNYFSAEHDEIIVKIDGDRATMVGKSRVNAAVYGGGRHTWKLRGDFTLVKESGYWKLESSEASTY
ncbi:MAG: nuclear transport factor 2 family protein [Bacilli bacterium]|nr:nuclear transport factor 2 family protein [Bacilli bacterium]